ncbi:hypothetical protein F4780DRAFT_134742 [Xylariomycetidae sp. FL0641]|nr:hypothetical protein F4780DRAFT_134742 [Xylariomycetidae sp. FL0641]
MARIRDLLLPVDEPPIPPRIEEPARQPNPAPETTSFTIELALDTICPFCYIGVTNLNTAINIHKQRHPDDLFEVTVTGFILMPQADRTYDKATYYSQVRGLPESRYEFWNHLGAQAGIRFSWGGRTGNSRDSHKLLRFALERTPTTNRSTVFANAHQQQQYHQQQPHQRQQPPHYQQHQQQHQQHQPFTSMISPGSQARRSAASPYSITSITSPYPITSPYSTGSSSYSFPAESHRQVTGSYFPNPTAVSPGFAPYAPPPAQVPQARGPGLQMRLLMAIFRGYHEQDRDLSDQAFLREVGTAVTGFPAAEIQQVLDSNEWARAIDTLSQDVGHRLCFPTSSPFVAVPTMIINGRGVYGGWQTVDYLVNELERLRRGGPRMTVGTAAMPGSGSTAGGVGHGGGARTTSTGTSATPAALAVAAGVASSRTARNDSDSCSNGGASRMTDASTQTF